MLAMEILLPGILAGIVAIGVTLAIERWGGRLGGLLGTLPTTIVPASYGIAEQSVSEEAFQAAMYAVPVGMLLDAMFLYCWRLIPRLLPDWPVRLLLPCVTALSLVAWFAAAVGAVLGMGALRDITSSLAPLGWAVTGCIAAVGVLACLRAPRSPRGSRKVGAITLVGRGLFAGSAISVAVWLVAVSGPIAAGVAAIFPAIFTTTMVSLWLSQGRAVQAGAVGPMMLGSTSVAAYAVLAAWSVPAFGIAGGSVVAWVLAASGVTLPAWYWLSRRAAGSDS